MTTECVPLTATERDGVVAAIARQKLHCPGCRGTDFTVGQALPLGFLFVSEDADTYMVALTCCTAGCPRPRTGVRLPGPEFRLHR